MTGETLTILVKDNGVGIPEEKLTSIRENIKRGTCENSIGLTNLDRRIKLFSGNEYGLDIQSTYEKGTEIIVRMRVSQT